MSLGLALAGGGLQGVAHIGVLKALEELDIKIDFISGTSSGSIFATLYALGYTTDEIKEIVIKNYKIMSTVERKRIAKIIKDYVFTKKIKTDGLINGIKVENIINKCALNKGISNISQVKLPLAIPTVDTISTKECIFVSNKVKNEDKEINYIYDISIGKAVRSSMAFPGIFNTSSFNEFNFIDGGTKDNLPVKVLKDMGATMTLGVSFDISKYEVSKSLFDVILRAVDIFSQKDVVNAQKISDIALEINTNGVSLLNIDDVDKCIQTGYDTIIKNKEKILKKYRQN